MKAILVIDMPKGCEECPLQSMFFDSDWNIQKGTRHISCRLRKDRATIVGGERPGYCPLEEVKMGRKNER